MHWKKVSQEKPPINKSILIGYFHCADEFRWFDVVVKRPYDTDKKYNPNYYVYKVHLRENERDLEDDFYWCEVDTPCDKMVCF